MNRRPRQTRRRSQGTGVSTAPAPAADVVSSAADALGGEVTEAVADISVAGRDINTPHWSTAPMGDWKPRSGGLRMQQMDWINWHGAACGASGVLFALELVRFVQGQPPSAMECWIAAIIYSVIYASRFDSIRGLAPHFRVTFYATTGWSIYYIAHLLTAVNHDLYPLIFPSGAIFAASTVYFYKHWIERMWRHFQEDRFRPYYVPGLAGLMYFHSLDLVDMYNQWADPAYWAHQLAKFPDQVYTIADVRLTGLFMSSMALFMITLHNKGVLTGGKNTIITVLFTIFVPALFLSGTHATLQASFP